MRLTGKFGSKSKTLKVNQLLGMSAPERNLSMGFQGLIQPFLPFEFRGHAMECLKSLFWQGLSEEVLQFSVLQCAYNIKMESE